MLKLLVFVISVYAGVKHSHNDNMEKIKIKNQTINKADGKCVYNANLITTFNEHMYIINFSVVACLL